MLWLISIFADNVNPFDGLPERQVAPIIDHLVHATSSAGMQAGLVTACPVALKGGLPPRSLPAAYFRTPQSLPAGALAAKPAGQRSVVLRLEVAEGDQARYQAPFDDAAHDSSAPRRPPAPPSWIRRIGMALGGAVALAGAVAFRRLRA